MPFSASVRGGDDTLTGGSGDDVLWGDGVATAGGPGVGTELLGGADTFVFSCRDGIDTIMDFRAADGDVIDLLMTHIAWSDLDTNANSVLDDDDGFVASDGIDTVIDIGLASSGSAAGRHTITVLGVTGLQQSDFLLV